MEDELPTGSLDILSHFSVSSLIAGFLFGIIGFYLFRHGKKTMNYGVIFCSIGLMCYTLFTSGPLLDWGVGFALCGLAYYLDKNANLTG